MKIYGYDVLFYKAIKGTPFYEKYGSRLISHEELWLEDNWKIKRYFTEVKDATANEILACYDAGIESGDIAYREDIYYAAIAEVLKGRAEESPIRFDEETIREAAAWDIEIHAGEEDGMITAADGKIFFNADHAEKAGFRKCAACGHYFHFSWEMHDAEQRSSSQYRIYFDSNFRIPKGLHEGADDSICNFCDKYNVRYLCGVSRYGTHSVDWMMVEINDIELYAEVECIDPESCETYDELKAEILSQASENGIPEGWLKFWFDQN